MKIPFRHSRQTANALLVVLLAMGILTACMGSYLALTSSQNKSVMRSLCWNAALPLAEAGAEEALSHMNRNIGNYNADGWTGKGSIYTKPPRTLGDGYYSVTISGTPQTIATITSVGYAHWMDSTYVPRTVQLTAQPMSIPLPVGLVASNISFGGGFTADSYDSTNPLYSSTNATAVGMYDPAKFTAQALIATPTTAFGMAGSSHIYGYVATAPGGSVSPKGAAIVGDKTYNTKASIQAGHFTNNYTTPMPEVLPPFQSANAPVSGTVNGNNYHYVLNGGKFMADSLDGLASMYVSGNSILYVTGEISLNKIVFAPGAHLDLYVGTPSLSFYPTIKGEDFDGNQTLAVAPAQLTLWGLPSCKSMSMTAQKAFIGVIYAPQAELKGVAGGQYYGAFMAGAFSCQGSFNFHYDSGLTNTVTPIGVRILSWVEL